MKPHIVPRLAEHIISAYHEARLLLEEMENFRLSPDNPAHKQVWDTYRRKGRTYSAVGVNGDRLRVYRAQADYDSEIADLPGLLDDSLDLADKIFYYLAQIKRALT